MIHFSACPGRLILYIRVELHPWKDNVVDQQSTDRADLDPNAAASYAVVLTFTDGPGSFQLH